MQLGNFFDCTQSKAVDVLFSLAGATHRRFAACAMMCGHLSLYYWCAVLISSMRAHRFTYRGPLKAFKASLIFLCAQRIAPDFFVNGWAVTMDEFGVHA